MTGDLDVMLAPGVFPPDAGGPATFAPTIGRELAERGHRVRVITNGTAPDGFDERYPFNVVRIPRGESVARRYARQFRTLFAEYQRFDPDAALVNAFDLQAVTTARLAGVPVTTKVVGDNAWERARRAGVDEDIEAFQQRSYGPKVRAFKAIRSFQTRAANSVVVPSEYLRDLVVEWGVPRERTRVVYNAVDIDAPDVPIADRERRVVTVGRLVPWKGIDGLIDAFARLADDHPRLELHIVGDGPERSALERHARDQQVDDCVRFHGRVPHGQVLELVAKSRVFALNSTYEGLPHVVLEAMACGTPVVASRAGGTPEAVVDGETGLLVEPDDEAALAAAVAQVLSDDEMWHHLRERAYRRLTGQFEHNRMVDAYEDVLVNLAKGRP